MKWLKGKIKLNSNWNPNDCQNIKTVEEGPLHCKIVYWKSNLNWKYKMTFYCLSNLLNYFRKFNYLYIYIYISTRFKFNVLNKIHFIILIHTFSLKKSEKWTFLMKDIYTSFLNIWSPINKNKQVQNLKNINGSVFKRALKIKVCSYTQNES